jgi:protoheme IX farnesyltransferase
MNQMVWYTLVLIALTMLPVAFRALGGVYAIFAGLLDIILLAGVLRVRAAKDFTAPAWWVYKFSLLYLALIFAAMVVDRQMYFSANTIG